MLNFHNATIADFAGQPARADLRTGPVAMANRPQSMANKMIPAWDAGECLTLQVLDFADTGIFQLHFELNVDVFDDGASKRAVEHFINLLDAMLAAPDGLVSAAPMLTVAERKAITFDPDPSNRLSSTIDAFWIVFANGPFGSPIGQRWSARRLRVWRT